MQNIFSATKFFENFPKFFKKSENRKSKFLKNQVWGTARGVVSAPEVIPMTCDSYSSRKPDLSRKICSVYQVQRYTVLALC